MDDWSLSLSECELFAMCSNARCVSRPKTSAVSSTSACQGPRTLCVSWPTTRMDRSLRSPNSWRFKPLLHPMLLFCLWGETWLTGVCQRVACISVVLKSIWFGFIRSWLHMCLLQVICMIREYEQTLKISGCIYYMLCVWAVSLREYVYSLNVLVNIIIYSLKFRGSL